MKTFNIAAALFALTAFTAACEPADLSRFTNAVPGSSDTTDDYSARPPKVGDCDGGTSICDVPDSLN